MPPDRILVLGLMGRYPMAGVGWQALQYVLGLQRLGFDVYYAEDSGAPPYDPRAVGLATDSSDNVAFVRDVMKRTPHPERWVYWDCLEDRHHGLGRSALDELYATSAQVWNLCGATRLPEERIGSATRVYVQTDPGVEQVAAACGDRQAAAQLAAHDVHFTYGENLTRAGASLPDGGVRWHPTRPPVLLDTWSSAVSPGASFSTVGSWENHGKDVTWEGRTYRWSKHDAFADCIDAPARAGVAMEAALAPPEEISRRLRDAGWSLRDPYRVSADLDVYRNFILSSAGEFTVAKDVYVRSRSGWFSDRSACSLAAGRPVVTHDTGFDAQIPTGRGLLAFSDSDGAADALRDVSADLAGHARAARTIAEEYFDASKVLTAMLRRIG